MRARRAWDGTTQPGTDFLLATAWSHSLRFNSAGWALRGLVLSVVCLVCALNPGWAAMLVLVPLVGWVFAGLEVFADATVSAGASRPGLVGLIARHLEATRQVAGPSLSGVLENVGAGALLLIFVGPAALELSATLRDVGVTLAAGYGAVAAAQMVTDAGYYNHEPGRVAGRVMVLSRWSLPLVYAGVAVLLARHEAQAWVLAVVPLTYLGVFVIGLLSDSFHATALTTHLVAGEEQAHRFAAELGEEVHRVGIYLSEMARSSRDPKVARALAVAFAEVDAVRERATRRELGRPASVGSILDSLWRKSEGRPSVSADDADLVVCHAGATLMRHVVLDLTANAREVGATTVGVAVTVVPIGDSLVTITVRVTDNGPGFEQPALMHDFREGSSRWALNRMCRQARGSLTYQREDGRTIAEASYRTNTQGELA